jgi:type IV pilus assembly protein PilA
MKSFSKTAKGFTLIEILIVIGIIAILAAIVIVAINPSKQFAQARNTQRESNVNTLLNAIGQNIADNKGLFGGTVAADICNGLAIPAAATDIGTGVGFINLSCLVPTYIPQSIPLDPSAGTAADTFYTVSVDAVKRYTICAPQHAEASVPGSVPYCLTR